MISIYQVTALNITILSFIKNSICCISVFCKANKPKFCRFCRFCRFCNLWRSHLSRPRPAGGRQKVWRRCTGGGAQEEYICFYIFFLNLSADVFERNSRPGVTAGVLRVEVVASLLSHSFLNNNLLPGQEAPPTFHPGPAHRPTRPHLCPPLGLPVRAAGISRSLAGSGRLLTRSDRLARPHYGGERAAFPPPSHPIPKHTHTHTPPPSLSRSHKT